MPKLIDSELKEKIKIMVKGKVPIRVISKKLKLPISTVHYNVRKISKNYRRLFRPIINDSDKEKLGEVLGIIAGDGSIFDRDYRVTVTLSFKEINYARFVQKLFLDVFGKKFNIFAYQDKNKVIISARSKEMYEFILKFLEWERPKVYSIHLRTPNLPVELYKGFLRGIFDTDGNIDDWGSYKRLTISSVSKKLSGNVQFGLKLFEINFYLRAHNKSMLVRVDKEDAINFMKLIGTNNSRYENKWEDSLVWSRTLASG